jgi:hypothetical protein
VVRIRRSWLALLSAGLLFAGVQTGLALGIQAGWLGIRSTELAVRVAPLKQRSAEEPAPPFRVVVLGTSRAQWGCRACVLERELPAGLGQSVAVCNLGKPGGGLVRSLLDWYRLRREGVRPDLLLVEVLPAFLAHKQPFDELNDRILPTCELSWDDVLFLERYARPPRREQVRRKWLRETLVLCHGQRRALLSRTVPKLLPASQRRTPIPGEDLHPASQVVRGPEASVKAWARTQTDYGPILADFHFGERPCAALRELLQACRADGVRVSLVLFPEGRKFRRLYPPKVWAAIERFLTNVSQKHDAPVINARRWVQDEADFFDSHHLLERPAERVTARLAREAVAPMLRGRLAFPER